MSPKFAVMLGMTIGSIVGGYLPTFFGISPFSFISLLGNTVGGIVGIYVGYKLTAG